jgi:hypothetical protein
MTLTLKTEMKKAEEKGRVLKENRVTERKVKK